MSQVVDRDPATLSYEEALTELDGVIVRLEGGEVALADAIACYERGVALAQHCAALLDRTEAQITQLMVSGSGQIVEKPLPAEVGAVTPSHSAARPEVLFPGSRESGPPIDPDEIPF